MENNITPKTPILGKNTETSNIIQKTLMANPDMIMPLLLMSGIFGDIPAENEETVPEIVIPKSKFTNPELSVLPLLLMTGLAQYVIPKTKLINARVFFGPTLIMAGLFGPEKIVSAENIEPVTEKQLVEKIEKVSKPTRTPDKDSLPKFQKNLTYSNFISRASKFVSRVGDFLVNFNKSTLEKINLKKKNLERQELSSTERNQRYKSVVTKEAEQRKEKQKTAELRASSLDISSALKNITAGVVAAAGGVAPPSGGEQIFSGVLRGRELITEAGAQNVSVKPEWVPIPAGTRGLYYSSGFGDRYGRPHKGLDIAGPTGTPIITPITGVVTYARFNNGGYGKLVEVTKGNIVMLFAHLNEISVRENQNVTAGTQIGTLGSTGRSTGPHLHWEVRVNGSAVNPAEWTKTNSPDAISTTNISPASQIVVFAGHNDVLSGETGTGGPQGSRIISPGESNEQYFNRMIAQAIAGMGLATYIPSTKTRTGTDPNSNWSRAKEYARQGYIPIEIHYDEPAGRSGLIRAVNRPISSKENALIRDFGVFPMGYRDLGGPRRGLSLLEVAPLTAPRIANPSRYIQSDAQKIARSLRSASPQSDGGVTHLAQILVGEAGPEFVIPMSKMKNFINLVTVEKVKSIKENIIASRNKMDVAVNRINLTSTEIDMKTNGLSYEIMDDYSETVTYYYQPTIYYS